jgi:hypothetical protein
MTTRTVGNTLVVVALTLTWLVTIPLELLFWIRVIGWPLDLTLLITLPIMGVLIPVSYPIAIIGNERFRYGEAFLPAEALGRSGWLGVLGALLSVCAVWLYMLLHDAQYWRLLIVGVLAFLLVGVVIHTVRKLLSQIGRAGATQTEDGEGRKMPT